jgi:hypothetical protein
MDKYIWILCIILITFIIYVKYNYIKNKKNKKNNDLLIINAIYKNDISSNTSNTLPDNNYDDTDIIEENVDDLKKIKENIEDFEKTEENISYPINTKRTYEYNKKGILAKINPEPIPRKKQENVIKKEYNPRIESFAPHDQILVNSLYIESNYINQLDFPENTSDELPIFNADTVSQIYSVDNITSLYNTINSDIYKGYKTIDFI